MNKHYRILYLVFIFALASCTWVKTNPEAESVRIVPTDRVVGCAKLGEITAYTKAVVAGVNRKASKIQEELASLAKIEAAEMSADTITAISKVVNGRQAYMAYRCKS